MQTKSIDYDMRISQLLKDTKSSDSNSISLYQHIQMMYNEYFNEPKNIYSNELDHFEKLSQFIKKNGFIYQKSRTSEQIIKDQIIIESQDEIFIKKQQSLLQESIVPQIHVIIPNYVHLNSILDQAGYGIGEENAWKLQASIKRFLQPQLQNFSEVRFWGKMLANGSDYYVLELLGKQSYREELPEDCEQNGTGANEYIHYVTQDLSEDWNLLPNITRQQMELSRFIKYSFTGDLERQPLTYPQFSGREKHLLKAQIIRITHSNYIAPRGLYKVNDDNSKVIEFEEEFKLPEPAEIATLESWVHVPPNILKMGRVSHWVGGNLPEEVRQQKLDDLVVEDPELDRLKSIVEDKPVEGYETGWLVKNYGETQLYTNSEDAQDFAVYCGLEQLPYAMYKMNVKKQQKSTFVSIYIGYGYKYNQSPFVPIAPIDIQEEPEDNEEFPEPNPKTLADELEPDSDDERRKIMEQQEAEQQNQ